MKISFVTITDFVSAALVLVSLFYVKDNQIFWLLYALGCFIYVGINTYKKLYGQAIMNIVACLIAINNFLK